MYCLRQVLRMEYFYVTQIWDWKRSQKKIMSHSEMFEELLWRKDFWKLILKYLNHNMHYLILYTSHQYVLKYFSHPVITIWRTPNR
jgi:hypothetical protein